MRKILAIAYTSARNALRSKVSAALALLMFTAILLLPLLIQSDGSIEGYVRILLQYTLGCVTAALSVASLWAGCAAVSTELRDRQMHLLAVKPVPRAAVWLGKWIGLLAVNAILLIPAGTVTYLVLQWNTRPGAISEADRTVLEEQLLTARTPVKAANFDPTRPATVAAGESAVFRFELPEKRRTGRPLHLRYQLVSSAMMTPAADVIWQGKKLEHDTRVSMNRIMTLTVPESEIENNRVELTFTSHADEGTTLLFTPEQPPELLYTSGGFSANYLKALLMIYAHLAFMAAVGVTFGTLFTLPVAVCCAGWLLMLLASATLLQELATETAQPDESLAGAALLWHRVSAAYYGLLYKIIEPLKNSAPLQLVAGGESIPRGTFLQVFTVKALIYSLIAALPGVAALHHKEIAGLNRE